MSRAQAQQLADQAASAKGAEKEEALRKKAEIEKAADKYLEEAGRYAEKAERLNLDSANGKLYKGRFLFTQGGEGRNTGLTLLEQVVASQPDNSTAHTILGQAYLSLNRADKAYDEFQQAIVQKPDNVVALRSAIGLLIRKGDVLSRQRAQTYLQQALNFAPRDSQLDVYRDIVGNPADAIRVREQTYKTDPNNQDNVRRLAYLYVTTKNIPKAIEILRPLYDKQPDDLVLADSLAKLYRDTQKFNEAALIYEHFLTNANPTVRYEATVLYGDYLRSRGLNDQAIATYKNAVTADSSRDDAIGRLADLYFDLEDMVDAESLYRKMYESTQRQNVRVERRLIETYINEGKYPQAEEALASLFKKYPKDVNGMILQGYAMLRQQKVPEALAVFDEVIKEHPDNVDALHFRALALFSTKGDIEQATRDLMAIRDKSADLIMGNQSALLVNSRLILIKIYRQQRKFGEAADEYEEIIKTLQPSSSALRMDYADYLLVLARVAKGIAPDNRDPFAQDVRTVRPMERLEALLKDSRAVLPDLWQWSTYEGRALALNGQMREAQQKYAQAFAESKGNSEAASFYLDSLLATANYQDVVEVTTKLIAGQPHYGDFYVKRAIGYAGLKDMKHASADFHAALDLASKDGLLFLNVSRQAIGALTPTTVINEMQARLSAQPGDIASTIALADAYMASGKDDQAIKLLSPLTSDTKPTAQRGQLLRMLALAKQRTKDFEGASKDYQEMLKIVPDDLEGLNNYSFMLAEDMHQPEEGLKYAERAVKVLRGGNVDIAFVNNGNVYDTYGWVKFLSGDATGAIVELRRAVQIEPIPVAYVHLAKALAKEGQSREAYKVLEDAISSAKKTRDPFLPQLEAALKDLH